MIDFKKHSDETEEQFLWRIGQMVDSGEVKNWSSINDIVNRELGIEEDKWRDESSFRKRYQAAKKFYYKCFLKMEDPDLQEKIRKIEREKIKLRDERRAWNKENYKDSRFEETLELLENDLKNFGKINFPEHDSPIINSKNEMLIILSDWHIGQCFKSVFGAYNSDIASERLAKLFSEVQKYAELFKVKKANIICCGDFISGNIHKNIQITNKENVIRQIKTATEYLTSFLYKCSQIFEIVEYYNVLGNHSRLDKKEDAIHDERMDDLIGWATSLALDHIDNIFYNNFKLDSGICIMKICDKSYVGVHGDFDSMNKSGISNLCMMLGFKPEAIIRGHLHTPAYEIINGVTVIQGGSLAGSGDQYTIEKRLSGNPSQTICICDETGIKVHIPIEL